MLVPANTSSFVPPRVAPIFRVASAPLPGGPDSPGNTNSPSFRCVTIPSLYRLRNICHCLHLYPGCTATQISTILSATDYWYTCHSIHRLHLYPGWPNYQSNIFSRDPRNSPDNTNSPSFRGVLLVWDYGRFVIPSTSIRGAPLLRTFVTAFTASRGVPCSSVQHHHDQMHYGTLVTGFTASTSIRGAILVTAPLFRKPPPPPPPCLPACFYFKSRTASCFFPRGAKTGQSNTTCSSTRCTRWLKQHVFTCSSARAAPLARATPPPPLRGLPRWSAPGTRGPAWGHAPEWCRDYSWYVVLLKQK